MSDIVLFRIAERLTLTGVVLLIALVVMIGFWRTVQELNVAEGGKLGVAGSFVFSTPVFVLLAVIGYAYVSLSHPISVAPEATSDYKSASSNSSGFVGSSGSALQDGSGVSDYERTAIYGKVKSINCLGQNSDMSPRVQDDMASLKLALLEPVWSGDFAGFDSFSEWAMGLSTNEPNPEARAVFESVHPVC